MIKHELFLRILRFTAVGGLVFVVFTGLNWLLDPLVGKNAAFLIAYPPAVLLHFCLSKWWTFGCQRVDSKRQVSEYLLMVLVTFFIQAAVFRVLTTTTLLPGWAAAGISNAVQMVVTFLAMQGRVFAPQAGPKS